MLATHIDTNCSFISHPPVTAVDFPSFAAEPPRRSVDFFTKQPRGCTTNSFGKRHPDGYGFPSANPLYCQTKARVVAKNTNGIQRFTAYPRSWYASNSVLGEVMISILSIMLALALGPAAVDSADVAAFREGSEDMFHLYVVALVSKGDDKTRLLAEADALDSRLYPRAQKLVDGGYWRMDKHDPKLDRALWDYIVKHNDMALLGRTLPDVKTIANGGTIYNLDYAQAYDQWSLQMTGFQRFGTQTDCATPHDCTLKPMEDPDHVDARRRAIGIDTTAAQELDRLNHPVIFVGPVGPSIAKP